MVKKINFRMVSDKIPLKSSKLRKKVADLIEEGSARRILVKKGKRTLLEIPLVIGLGSASAAILLHAPLTAILAITALSSNVSIVVCREKTSPDS